MEKLLKFLKITKGSWFYEAQIVWFVFMWLHDTRHKPQYPRGIYIGRLHIWYDTAWKMHGLASRVRWFFADLTWGSDQYSQLSKKLIAIHINARHMFRSWSLELKWVDYLLSLRAYLRLAKNGFRITHSEKKTEDYDFSSEMFRFWWKGKIINDMGDIDRVGKYWNTMFKGHATRLGNPVDYKPNKPIPTAYKDSYERDLTSYPELEDRVINDFQERTFYKFIADNKELNNDEKPIND